MDHASPVVQQPVVLRPCVGQLIEPVLLAWVGLAVVALATPGRHWVTVGYAIGFPVSMLLVGLSNRTTLTSLSADTRQGFRTRWLGRAELHDLRVRRRYGFLGLWGLDRNGKLRSVPVPAPAIVWGPRRRAQAQVVLDWRASAPPDSPGWIPDLDGIGVPAPSRF